MPNKFRQINLKNKKILVTGGSGFIGTYVVKNLLARGVPKKNIFTPRSKICDLRNYKNCEKIVKNKDIVIHLAGNVGGIGLNSEKPAELFYDNLIMGINLIEASKKAKIKKFVTVGTVCSYPKITPVPFSEKNLWNGYPEETNAPYGLAKKTLLVQGQAYRKQYNFNCIHILLVNTYGPGEKFNSKTSHVIPAIIKKIDKAKKNNDKSINVWGTGKASREFIYVEDSAEGIILATEIYNKPEPINIGSGQETTIKNLVKMLCKIMDFKGKIIWDKSKPDGQPKRLLNISRAKKELGFTAKTQLEKGLRNMVNHYNKFNER